MPKATRLYLHPACGGMTQVSGEDLKRMMDPFSAVPGTYCAGCDRVVPLTEVHWDGATESVDEWRQRARGFTPAFLKLWRLGGGGILGTGLGLFAGWLMGSKNQGPGLVSLDAALLMIFGALAGGLLFALALTPILYKYVFKLDYYKVGDQ